MCVLSELNPLKNISKDMSFVLEVYVKLKDRLQRQKKFENLILLLMNIKLSMFQLSLLHTFL